MIKRRALKQFRRLKTTMMSYGAQERRTKRAGSLSDRFRKSHSVEECVWRDEKDFTLEVPLNSQNNRVYGFENKYNVQDNRLFHHTNRQSLKVMVSACVTWKGATKPFFVNDKGLKVNSKTHKNTWKKSFCSKSIVLWITILSNWAKSLLSTQNGPHHPQIIILLATTLE